MASIALYGGLFIYSNTISISLLGIPLYYGGTRFSPLGLNPHQFACYIAPVIILAVRNYFSNKSILNISLVIASIMLGNTTKSSTLILALFLTGCVFVFFRLLKISKNKQETILFAIFIFFILCILFVGVGYDLLKNFIYSDENGKGRLDLFISAIHLLDKNIFFGIGPGIHALNGIMEFHNTYLELLAMTGIFGLLIYLFFMVKMLYIGISYTSLIYVIIPLHFLVFLALQCEELFFGW